MSSINKVRLAVRLGIAIGAATSLSFSNAVLAEENEPESQLIRITGSKIKRAEAETAQPVLFISAEDISRSGLISVGDVLKEISTNGASLGLQTNNGNTGGNVTVDLRDCGSNRTLVLIDGNRWIAGLGGSVDLSAIPLPAIKRIEVLKDGASSIYGTDAICGVVNIITTDEFDGAQFKAYSSQYTEGDGEKQSFSLTIGSTSKNSSVLLGASYTQQKPVLGGDREISSVPIFGLPANVQGSGGRASPTTPYGRFRGDINGVTTIYTLTPGTVGCVANAECNSLTDFKVYDRNTDGYNFAPVNYLLQPNETRSLFVKGSFDINSNTKARASLVYNNRTSEAQLAAQPLGGLTIEADNIYNPFGTKIEGASFRPIVAPRSFAADVTTWNFSTGIEGDFEIGDKAFDWEVGYVYADSNAVQLKNGFFNAGRMTDALGASFIDGAGVATCGTVADPISGCTPFNIFGGPNGVTQDMLDYVSVAPRNLTFSKMDRYSASISGDLFELPAGSVAAYIGAESRRESGYTNPDPLTQSGQVLGDNAAVPTKGGFSVDEFSFETIIPLLADAPFAHSLELSLSSRYSDYSVFGSTNNSSYKLSYRPVKELLIRASYGEGFRAPSIAELFQGQNGSRPSATDPCSNDSTPYLNSADVRARCAADGVPASFQQGLPQFNALVGGNPNLQPEEAITKVLGFVYSPEAIENLGISVDWYNIQLENAIGAQTAQAIANSCYVIGNANDCALVTRDFTGSLSGVIGEISNVLSLNQNFIGGLEREGFDVNVDYRFDTDFGKFRINWDTAVVLYRGDLGHLSRGDLNADGNISTGNEVGELNAGQSGGGSRNKVKSNISLSWNHDVWSASLTAQYLSSLEEDCRGIITSATGLNMPELRDLCSNPDATRTTYAFAPGTSDVVATPDQPYATNELEATVYFDAQAGWTSPWETQFTVGVRNLFDKEPPLAFSAFANTYDPAYRLPGRQVYLGLTHNF